MSNYFQMEEVVGFEPTGPVKDLLLSRQVQ